MNTQALAFSCLICPRSRARLLAALVLPSLMLVASVKADTSLWTGAVNGNWNTTNANWTNGGSGIYTTGDFVQFGDTGGANLTISVAATLSPASVTFTDTGAGTNAYIFNTSAINGTGALSLASGFGGSVRFNVANGYTGATTLAGGTVQVGVSNALGATSSVLNLSGGSLQSIGGALRTLGNSSIVATTGTTTSLAAAASGGDLTLSGALTGSGTISVNNSAAGTVWLSGNLSGYTGTINYNNVNNGNNFFISGGADLSQAKVVLTGATVSNRRFGLGSAGSASIGELSGTGGTIGVANNNSGVFTIGALNTNSSFGGVFINVGSGVTSVTKVGTGTLTLSGVNTNTGTFRINAGTLKFGANNVLAGGSSIALGGGTLNLGGFTSNVFSTALSMSSSSTIDFGTHVGPLTLKFADSHSATWTGNLTLLNFVVGTDNLSFTSISGLSVGQLSQIALAGYTATGLNASGNVQFSAIPEPSTYAALAGMAMLGMAVLRRRKR